MNKSVFNYDLPKELIAQTPLADRSSSRLLVYNRATKSTEHKHFYNIIDYLHEGDVLVVNNTKVIPARLIGKKATGAKIEVFLLNKNSEVLVKPLKRLKDGDKVYFADNVYGTFSYPNKMHFNVENILDYGEVPLPHYIHNKVEMNRYNTIYSKVDGSVAAPTAGLHFTEELFKQLESKGVKIANITLHVGLGTFLPVKTDDILNHKMHSEWCEVSEEAAKIINNAKRIIAVGTTSVRTLESVYQKCGKIQDWQGETNIFIYPPYQFKAVQGIITNFHLPESTLIMLVSAFVGIDETMKLYNLAVKEKYRFYSLGDAMLII